MVHRRETSMSFLYCLRVSSRFRVTGESHDFQVDISPQISTSQDCTVVVSQVTIPVSWYTFTQGVNDQIVLAYQPAFGDPYVTALLTIQQGFYDADTFCELFQGLLQATTGGAQWNVFLRSDGRLSVTWGTPEASGNMWAILPNEALGSFAPGYVDSPQIPPGWTGASANHTIGLRSKIPQVIEQEGTLVFDGLYNSLHTSSVYLHSNLSTFSSQGPAPGDRDVICRIPVTAPYGGFAHFQDSGSDMIMFPVTNQTVSKLRFWVTDSVGMPLNLQGADVEVELWFYDKP